MENDSSNHRRRSSSSSSGSFSDEESDMTVRTLSGALKKRAEKEINENPARVQADLDVFREWLKKQSHLQSVNPSDQWLLAFLRGGKFSIERSKVKLDMYYTLKTIAPEIYAERDPLHANIQEILKLGAFLPLRKCEKEDSPRICIMRLGIFKSGKINLYDLIKVAIMITEVLMIEDDNFTVAGEEVVVDMKDVGVNILSQWTPTLAKKAISCFEKAMPIRVRNNHILNTPTGFETLYSIFKMFLGSKMKKRIHVHNQDYKAMHKIISKSVLPTEYGGKDGSIDDLVDHWKTKIESYRDWFLEQESARSDESKRMDTPQNSAIVFGVEGSFRKLEVD